MDIQKYINKSQPEEPIFHSNAYARVAQGDTIGSTDKQTFQERLHIHRNRQAVKRYGDSLIGRGEMRESARSQMKNPLRQPESRASTRQGFNRGVPARGAAPVSRPNFREPPTRGYNPYG